MIHSGGLFRFVKQNAGKCNGGITGKDEALTINSDKMRINLTNALKKFQGGQSAMEN